jgi:hypothetical protein
MNNRTTFASLLKKTFLEIKGKADTQDKFRL